jgi:hypothetical protein
MAKGPLRRILYGVVLVVGLPLSMHYQADMLMSRALSFTFPGWIGTYKSAWPRLGGGVSVKDVTIVAPDRGDALHFERVRLEVPFFQYYWSALKPWRDKDYKSISDFRLVFEGGKGDLTWPLSHEMALFGNASASPFEAEGCAQDGVWLGDELPDMGLTTGATELVMAYHFTADREIKEQSIHTPGASRVDFRRELVLHDMGPPLGRTSNPQARLEVASDEWHVKDEGFVAARNAYCAKKDGIDSARFLERHLATAKRVMQAAGLAPGTEMLAAYRRFASSGGSLDLTVRYDPPIGAPLYGSDDLGTWVPRIHGEFSVGEQRQSLALASTPVRELPEDEDEQGASVYALMQREGTAPESAPTDSAPTESAAPVVATATAPPPVHDPLGAPAAMTTMVASAAPAAVAPPPASAPPAAPVANKAPAGPDAAATDTPRGEGKLNLASTARVTDSVASVNAPPPLSASTAPADATPPTLLDYAQLGAAVGQRVMVYQKNKEPMLAEVVGMDKGTVHIRRHLRSGWVEYAVDRANFDYAERRN